MNGQVSLSYKKLVQNLLNTGDFFGLMFKLKK